MTNALRSDKVHVVEILTTAFQENLSVLLLTGLGDKRMLRIKSLMEYAFDMCFSYGKVLLSENRKACALVLFADQKKGLRPLFLDLKLIFRSIGLMRLNATIRKEALIKKRQPAGLKYYLWFIGVEAEFRNLGNGGKLLDELLADAHRFHRLFCLETSTLSNINWYRSHGLKTYNQIDLGFPLSMMCSVETEPERPFLKPVLQD